jgi:chemotaxis protein CheD
MTNAMLQERRAKNSLVVGIADMKTSGGADDVIITHALGSCLGIVIYDPAVRVGGMLHAMLPEASGSPERAKENPYAFVDSGLPLLFKACYALGAVKGRVLLTVAGGASMKITKDGDDLFQIGRRNYVALRKMLWKNGVLVHKQLVGGNTSRTMQVSLDTGLVRVTTGGVEIPLEGGNTPWQ